jgi:hypothetical protein
MDARQWVLAALITLALAPVAAKGQMPRQGLANARSQNFVVSTVDPDFAQALLKQAETCRREQAIEWFGKELPPSPQPISLNAVEVGPQVPASGVTQFGFSGTTPHGFQMVVAGSKERILDSVLPHEVLHTVFATFFGRPVIRWADEGCCTTTEHASERKKQDKLLIEFLHTDRGIAFNKMFRMDKYPRDMLPLYSQGYSLCRYLIAQGGKRKFMDYLREGMSSEQWDAVTKKFYGYEDLSDLQVTWVEWVRNGSNEDVASRSANVAGEESLVVNADAPPAAPPSAKSAVAVANPGDRAKTMNQFARNSGPVASYYDSKAETSRNKELAKPIAGRVKEAAPGASTRTNARPMEPQKVQQRALSWGNGAGAAGMGPTRPAAPAKKIPSTTKAGAYESPKHRQPAPSAISTSHAGGTKFR